MSPDRFRVFTKRGAAVGVLAVAAATLVLLAAGIVIAVLLVVVR